MLTGKGIEFDAFLSRIIDEELTRIFGRVASQTIFSVLKEDYSLERNEISRKAGVFAASLEEIFGSGALIIEKCIIRRLCAELRLEYKEKRGFSFAKYVKELRERCKEKTEHTSMCQSSF